MSQCLYQCSFEMKSSVNNLLLTNATGHSAVALSYVTTALTNLFEQALLIPRWVNIFVFEMLSGQADMAFNFALVCTFFYAVIACLNCNCVLADPPFQKFQNCINNLNSLKNQL